MDENLTKEIEYYTNLEWTLIHGTDLDFNGNLYHFIEIKELPSFAFCAKTQQICLDNYKTQLSLMIQVMLENKLEIPIPGEDEDDIDWEALCP